jgi:hypothetical protein
MAKLTGAFEMQSIGGIGVWDRHMAFLGYQGFQ